MLLFSHWVYADDGLKAYWDAAQELQQQIEQKSAFGSFSVISDSKAVHSFSIISDHERFLLKRKYELKDIEELRLVCRKNTELYVSYMLLGEKEVKNPIAYQDEMMALSSFGVRCAAQVALLAWDSLRNEEVSEMRQQGVMEIKERVLNIYKVTLQGLGLVEIDNANKLRLAKALAESSEQYLPFISLNDRSGMIASIKRVQKASAPDVSRQLDKVITTLSSKECGWACQLEI